MYVIAVKSNLKENLILGGHCKSLEPEWIKLAKEMKGLIKIGAINCDDEKELAGHFGIKGKITSNQVADLSRIPDYQVFPI